MLCWLSVMESKRRPESSTGSSRTLGEPAGVRRVIAVLRRMLVEWVAVLLLTALCTLPSKVWTYICLLR